MSKPWDKVIRELAQQIEDAYTGSNDYTGVREVAEAELHKQLDGLLESAQKMMDDPAFRAEFKKEFDKWLK
jgi:hypothetical protein